MFTIEESKLAEQINAEIVSQLYEAWDGNANGAEQYRSKASAFVPCFSMFCEIKILKDLDNGLYYGVEINGTRYEVDLQSWRAKWEAAHGIEQAAEEPAETFTESDFDAWLDQICGEDR